MPSRRHQRARASIAPLETELATLLTARPRAGRYSCTFPKARFTTSFFVCRVIGDERHHILNENYVTRKGHGVESVVETTPIKDKAHLVELLDTVFSLRFPADTPGIDRFLPTSS